MSLNKFHEEIKKHALENPKEEVCGLIVLNNDKTISIIPCKNESTSKKNNFIISASKFISFKLKKHILGIYHSHPKGNECPSLPDINASKELEIPYLIYSILTNNFFLYYPSSYEPDDLLGRPYIKGFYECVSLLKDYFIKKLYLNITRYYYNYWLPECSRTANKDLSDVMESHFRIIELENIKEHDVIVFSIRKNYRQHVGIYIGNNDFIHQPAEGTSRKETLDNKWAKRIHNIYRHDSLV